MKLILWCQEHMHFLVEEEADYEPTCPSCSVKLANIGWVEEIDETI